MDTAVALRYAQESAAEITRSLADEARALIVNSHERFEEAGAFLLDIKRRRERIKAAFAPLIESAHRAHKEALALQKKADQPCEEAEAVCKRSMLTYQAAQERIRREAEEKAATERRRLEAEQRAEAERVRKVLEAEAEAARIRDAETAMDAGDLELAEVILESPPAPVVMAPPPQIEMPAVEAPPAPKAAGVSFRKSWTWRLIDPAAVNRAYLTPDEKRISMVVRALGPEAAAQVGGIEVFEQFGVVGRTA